MTAAQPLRSYTPVVQEQVASYTPAMQLPRGLDTPGAPVTSARPPLPPHRPMPPPKLTEGMPDLDSIKKQKAAYEQQIESELKRQAEVLEKQFRQLALWRKDHGEKLKQQKCLEIEALANQAQLHSSRQYNEDLMKLYQATQQQRLELELEAGACTKEWQAKKSQEDYLMEAYKIQKSQYDAQVQIMSKLQAVPPQFAQLQSPNLPPRIPMTTSAQNRETQASIPPPLSLQSPHPMPVTTATISSMQSPRPIPRATTATSSTIMVANPQLVSPAASPPSGNRGSTYYLAGSEFVGRTTSYLPEVRAHSGHYPAALSKEVIGSAPRYSVGQVQQASLSHTSPQIVEVRQQDVRRVAPEVYSASIIPSDAYQNSLTTKASPAVAETFPSVVRQQSYRAPTTTANSVLEVIAPPIPAVIRQQSYEPTTNAGSLAERSPHLSAIVHRQNYEGPPITVTERPHSTPPSAVIRQKSCPDSTITGTVVLEECRLEPAVIRQQSCTQSPTRAALRAAVQRGFELVEPEGREARAVSSASLTTRHV